MVHNLGGLTTEEVFVVSASRQLRVSLAVDEVSDDGFIGQHDQLVSTGELVGRMRLVDWDCRHERLQLPRSDDVVLLV